ncbi:MAG TPA: DUF2272 domain-containing protein [Falsiroseomonas sp.]|jgi:hypothetical protein|nr:DUF2272 domain-containing protein [Falsiroseomonas sp.]
MRRLLLLATLAACAAPPEPPLPYPPAAAERVIRLALAEWRDWGGVVQEAFAPTPSPAPFGSPETEPANFPRVLAYWQAVPQEDAAIRANRRRYAIALAGRAAAGPALWAEPAWSAAFISWVFRSAGVDAAEFPPSATHALYLDGLIAAARRFPATAPFLPRAPEERAPHPGDLVCRDRSAAPLRHWRERLAEGGSIRPMHCDIVVATPAGAVEAVGGNVGDAVTLTRFPAAPDGRLLPAPPGHAPIVLVVESRLGRLPPWSSPALQPVSWNLR